MLSPINEKILILSFHDLAPHSQKLFEDFLSEIRTLGIHTLSLLVVPNWHGQENILDYPEFIQWLNSLAEEKYEICMHGFTHQADLVRGGPIAQMIGRYYTEMEGEFYRISYQEAQNLISQGREIMNAAGFSYAGFISPAWLLSLEARRCIQEMGFTYTTYLHHVDFLQTNRKIYAPTLGFSSRSAGRRWVSQIWVRFWYFCNRNAPVLRLAIHPNDLIYPAIRETILHLIRMSLVSRVPLTYTQYCARVISRNSDCRE